MQNQFVTFFLPIICFLQAFILQKIMNAYFTHHNHWGFLGVKLLAFLKKKCHMSFHTDARFFFPSWLLLLPFKVYFLLLGHWLMLLKFSHAWKFKISRNTGSGQRSDLRPADINQNMPTELWIRRCMMQLSPENAFVWLRWEKFPILVFLSTKFFLFC